MRVPAVAARLTACIADAEDERNAVEALTRVAQMVQSVGQYAGFLQMCGFEPMAENPWVPVSMLCQALAPDDADDSPAARVAWIGQPADVQSFVELVAATARRYSAARVGAFGGVDGVVDDGTTAVSPSRAAAR